jgi:hypothetical protein
MTKPILPDWVQTELQRAPQAAALGLVHVMPALQAVAARFDARPAELAEIEISPLGTGLHWPLLNADLAVEGLLAGVFGSRAWMRQHAARVGRATSPQKALAARAYGAKGGRPRKVVA